MHSIVIRVWHKIYKLIICIEAGLDAQSNAKGHNVLIFPCVRNWIHMGWSMWHMRIARVNRVSDVIEHELELDMNCEFQSYLDIWHVAMT